MFDRLQALPGAGANNGPGICLFVDPGSGTLNAAGNVFAGPRDCAGPSPGALTVSTGLCNTAGVDIIIATYADGGFIGDAGNYGGNSIKVSNCIR